MPGKRTVSAKRRAASRSNGRKSTGPNTLAGKRIASLNSMKGSTATPGCERGAEAATRPLWQTMVALGEDPARYRSLLRDVVNSYPPQNPLELRVCEDITRLMLKLERIQQAQEAKVVRAYQKLESSREKRLREMEGSASYDDASQAEVLQTGLRRAPDSPAKFSETTACLERLRARVESGDFSDEAELNALYGKQPTFRGAGIINASRALAANPADRELAATLRVMILEEMRDVAAEGQLYYQEYVEISRAMRLECLAPAADREYVQLQRQEALLDRQLERKIKLLLSLQAADRRNARDAREPPAAVAGEPLGWLEGRGGSGSQPEESAAVASERAEKAPHSETPSPPLDTPAARAIALRHKIETPRSSGPIGTEQHEEMMRRIYEVYGLTWPRPEPPARNPFVETCRENERTQVAVATEGGEPSEPGEGSRPHFSDNAPQDSTGPPGE